VPNSEEEARDARYAFLLEALRERGPGLLLTGHHADDQAETVLFRILRGTGLRGLAGIPRFRPPGLLRPLLPFSRASLESYAETHGIRYRDDPSNQDRSFARNQIRLGVLPGLEKGPAPRAREALLRLALVARENEEAWRSLMPGLLSQVLVEKDGNPSLSRAELLAMHPGVRARVLREAMRGLGVQLDHVGTRTLLEFTRTGASGRELSLPGGFRIRREFDSFLLVEDRSPDKDAPLVLPGPGEGMGRAVVGGRTWEVRWGMTEPEDDGRTFGAPVASLRFPMRVRRWAPGDRIQLPYGSKKLKKLFLEARVPLSERDRMPVLVDARGHVLWVVGLRMSDVSRVPGEPDSFFVGMSDVHQP
jgi:tRNA(Ile)-lysidine synthase